MKKQRECRFLQARELRVQSIDGKRILSGYAAPFNSLSEDLGGWRERIQPGAFTRCLQSNPDISCLYEHDRLPGILGRTKPGTLKVMEDSVGLRFECQVPDTTLGNDICVSVERGDLDGCSFGFVTQEDNWTKGDDGIIVRTLIDVDVFDVTVTSIPAYAATSIQLRSRLFPDGAVEIPKELRSAEDDSCECDCSACQDGDCENCDCPGCDGDCEGGECRCMSQRCNHLLAAVLERRARTV